MSKVSVHRPTLIAVPSTGVVPPAPVLTEDVHRSNELSSETSLDDLFKAILGHEADDSDDRYRLIETVEAQVRTIRSELGLPEPVIEAPVPPPAPERRPEIAPRFAALASHDEPSATTETPAPNTRKVPGWFKVVAGLAWSRLPHPALMLASTVALLTRA